MVDLKRCTVDGETVEAYLNREESCHYTLQERKGKRGFHKSHLKDTRVHVLLKDKLPGKVKYWSREEIMVHFIKEKIKNGDYTTILGVCFAAIIEEPITAIKIYNEILCGTVLEPKARTAVNTALRRVVVLCPDMLVKTRKGRRVFYSLTKDYVGYSVESLLGFYYNAQGGVQTPIKRSTIPEKESLSVVSGPVVSDLETDPVVSDLIKLIKSVRDTIQGTRAEDQLLHELADIVMDDWKKFFNAEEDNNV
jgi:hypothetical protein